MKKSRTCDDCGVAIKRLGYRCADCGRKHRVSAIRNFVDEYKLNAGCENPNCQWEGEFLPVQLQFDHIDPATKVDAVSRMVGKKSMDEILQEISKCQVLCANCHLEKTWVT